MGFADFNEKQLDEYRDKLHKKMFWLLLYKDPETRDSYEYVDFDRYFKFLMKELSGLNDLLDNPPFLLETLSMLQAAYNESTKDPFNYGNYRKLVLDAHNILDRVFEEVDHDNNK